jgi:hypothetical protein
LEARRREGRFFLAITLSRKPAWWLDLAAQPCIIGHGRSLGLIAMRTIGGGLGAVLLCLQASYAGAAQLQTTYVGNWLVGSYSSDNTGGFSHCAASAAYRNGTLMLFAINKDFRWSMGFMNPQWQLSKGDSYPISFSVDGIPALRAQATALNDHQVKVELADSAALFNIFRRGQMLTVFAAGQTTSFRLTTTSELLPTLGTCVRENRERQTRMVANPFVSRGDGPSSEIKDKSPGEYSGALARRAEATSLLANILAQAGISGFQILKPADMNEVKADAAWRAGGSFGTLSITTDTNAKPTDLTSSILAGDARTCQGAFLSGSMPDDQNKQDVRVFTTCRSDAKTLTAYYSVLQRPEGGFYILATVGDEKPDVAVAKPTKTVDSGIRTAAYRILQK